MKTKIEKHYRLKAMGIVDLMHDTKFIGVDVTREHMRAIQNYIAYIIKSSVDSAIRAEEFLREVTKIK